jgi:hypothetical protein
MKTLSRDEDQHGSETTLCCCSQFVGTTKLSRRKNCLENDITRTIKCEKCFPSLMCSNYSHEKYLQRDPDTTMHTPIRKKTKISKTSTYRRKKHDPDEWIDKITVQNTPSIDYDRSIVRRLTFDNATHSRTKPESVIMPQLTPGQNHLIFCDMGISIIVTPLLCQKV